MSKGTQTREMILARAAQLFSRQGYFGTSIPDIMQETGLKKGGIYNHFMSREQLEIEAFEYSVSLVSHRFKTALEGKTNAIDRLLEIIGVFDSLIENPVLVGGCPVLNTAIESDDAIPSLRDHVQKAMDDWRALIQRIVTRGIERGEVKAAINPDELATIMISSLEGAIMMSKLYNDAAHMRRVVAFLTNYIESAVRV